MLDFLTRREWVGYLTINLMMLLLIVTPPFLAGFALKVKEFQRLKKEKTKRKHMAKQTCDKRKIKLQAQKVSMMGETQEGGMAWVGEGYMGR